MMKKLITLILLMGSLSVMGCSCKPDYHLKITYQSGLHQEIDVNSFDFDNDRLKITLINTVSGCESTAKLYNIKQVDVTKN